MRVVVEIIQEMILVLMIAELLAAVAALPLWWLLRVIPQIYFVSTFWEAWAITSVVAVGIVIVSWVVDLSKGVNL